MPSAGPGKALRWRGGHGCALPKGAEPVSFSVYAGWGVGVVRSGWAGVGSCWGLLCGWWWGGLGVGQTRRGAPWAGSCGNGVDRPVPPPAWTPSGGSGPGVGLGEVLQGPKRGASPPGAVRTSLRAAAAFLVVPLWGGRTASVGRWARPHSPARSAAGRGRPPPRPGRAPVAPLLRRFGRTRRPSRTAPSQAWTQTPSICSTARPRLPPPRCGHYGQGTLAVGAGPWARTTPQERPHGEGTPPKARTPPADWTASAHRIGDLREPSRPHSEAADRGRQAVADSRTAAPLRGSRRWATRARAARAGAAHPLRYPPRRRASLPGQGATGLEGDAQTIEHAPIAAPIPGDRITIQMVTGGRRWDSLTADTDAVTLGRRPPGPTVGPSHSPTASSTSSVRALIGRVGGTGPWAGPVTSLLHPRLPLPTLSPAARRSRRASSR